MSFNLTIIPLKWGTLKETENFPRISCWEKEKASARGELVSWREIHTAVRTFQIALQKKTEVQTKMGPSGMVLATHLDLYCLEVHILGPLF